MKGKRRWLLVPLVILALLLSVIPAYAIPPVPHAFYGTLTIVGSPAPVGTVVTAKVGGVQYGSITTTVEGQYGSSDPLGDRLLVAPGEGDIETGDTIYFYANGSVASQTYAFDPDEVTELNLTVFDTTAPTVSSTSPVADATGVAVETTVSVTFSEAMAESTITTSSFTLDSVAGSVSYDSGTYTATFTPSANLTESTTYTATLSTAITDVAGNPLAAEYSWSFTTTIGIPPTVSSVSPLDGAIDVATYTTVTATFDMSMDESTITIHTFLLDGVAGSVSYDSGTYTATFTPDAKLDSNTLYTVTLSTAITSIDGVALASAYSWSFTTVYVGDATEDGELNALDITRVERIIAGLDAETPGADANQDGNINALDITKVERIIAGLD